MASPSRPSRCENSASSLAVKPVARQGAQLVSDVADGRLNLLVDPMRSVGRVPHPLVKSRKPFWSRWRRWRMASVAIHQGRKGDGAQNGAVCRGNARLPVARDWLAAAELLGDQVAGTLHGFSFGGGQAVELRPFRVGDELGASEHVNKVRHVLLSSHPRLARKAILCAKPYARQDCSGT